MIVEKLKSKVVYWTGFSAAFIGTSFWECMYKGSYYHFTTVAFVAYTYVIHNECTSVKWKKISFIPLIACVNALMDEILGTACEVNWTEYVSLLFIIIHLFFRSKIIDIKKSICVYLKSKISSIKLFQKIMHIFTKKSI